jgi:hypothetical protein
MAAETTAQATDRWCDGNRAADSTEISVAEQATDDWFVGHNV